MESVSELGDQLNKKTLTRSEALKDAESTFLHAATLSAIGEDALLGAEILYHLGWTYWAAGREEPV